ncbi:MAG: IS66 family transposase [Nitrosotalea sp.]
MLQLPAYVEDLRKESRLLRIYTAQLKRANSIQKDTLKKIEDIVKNKDKRIRDLEKENEKLKQEIEKISKTKNRYQVALFDHGNFKHPDQQGKKTNGGQIGHADTNKDTLRDKKSFKKQRIFAQSCGKCGTIVSRVNSVKEKTLIDIQINTELIKLILQSERQWCKTCKHEVTARSLQTLPFTEYGINTFMMVLLLRFKSHQSASNISSVLSLGFGLKLSTSEIVSLLRQAREYLKEKYEELKKAIRIGEVMYNDETGWLVDGKKAWMWIMANEKATVYVAAESRGKGIFEEMYGDSNATSMHDGYPGYEPVTGKDNTAFCWAHVMRFAFEETVNLSPNLLSCQIRDRLVDLYQTIRINPNWSKEKKEETLRTELDSMISLQSADQTVLNIQYRVRSQKAGLILALLVTPDGTNNFAERELRNMAINRTISFGSKTFGGMEATAILGSIVQTISRNKEKQFLPTLKEYLFNGIQEKYPQYKHPPSFSP